MIYEQSAPPPPPPHLRFVVLQQPFSASSTRVVSHVEDHHALLLPADEGAVRHPLHHGQEVLVAVVARGHHGEGGPVVLLQHLEDDLQLQRGGAGELEVDGAALLDTKGHGEQRSLDATAEVSQDKRQSESCSLALSNFRWIISQN